MGNSQNSGVMSGVFKKKKKNSPNSQIGQEFECPKCKIIYPKNTTFNTMKVHLDECLNQDFQVSQSINNNQNQQQPQQQQIQQTLQIPSQTTQNQIIQTQKSNQTNYKQLVDYKENFFWVKVPQDTEKIKWKWERKKYNQIPLYQIKQMQQKGQQLAFPQKYEIFRSEVEKFRIPWQQGADWVTITKDSVLLSSLMEIQKVNLYKEVKVKIQGEKVEDAGGVLREWAHLIMKEAIDQFSGLFIMADTEDVTYKINNEADNDEHIINCFSLIGKILGKLVFEKVPINIYLDNTILKYLLGQKVELQDIFSYDKQLYKSWKHILDTDIQQDDFIGNFAIYKTDEKGQTHAIELIPNGEAIIIENSNKQQYVDLCIEYYTQKSIKPFLDAIANSFYKVIPKKLIENFEVHEFEMILNSTPFINIDDWKIHTEYQGKFKENDKIIQWFWEILYSFDQQQLQEFLRYCTGSTRPPIQGFKKLESNRGSYNKFTIRSIPFTKTNPFPIAHTCFNRLELPEYKDQFTMQTYMKAVVNNDLDGVFGME